MLKNHYLSIHDLQTTSEIIREIGGTDDFYSSFYDSDEVFIDIFLSALPKIDGLDFGVRHKITDSISRKKKRRKKASK